jgi:zinc transport system permease protein
MTPSRLACIGLIIAAMMFFVAHPLIAAAPPQIVQVGRYEVVGAILIDTTTGQCWSLRRNGWEDYEVPFKQSVNERRGPVGKYQLRTHSTPWQREGWGWGGGIPGSWTLAVIDSSSGATWRFHSPGGLDHLRKVEWEYLPPPPTRKDASETNKPSPRSVTANAVVASRYDTQILGTHSLLLDTATGQCWVSEHHKKAEWHDFQLPLGQSRHDKPGRAGTYQLRTSPHTPNDSHWLDDALFWLASRAPANSFFAHENNLSAMIALLLVSLACGAVGSLVVGGRMAFFSDALAHSSFAGVSIGFVMFTAFLASRVDASEFWDWVTPVMLGFGMLIGYGIAAVRQRTSLASDTVIGVFFAASLGLAATLRDLIQSRKLFSLESFLFGDPLVAQPRDIIWLAVQLVAVVVVLAFIYNSLLLSGFNTSLALSRQVRAQTASYVFIMLLAVVVTLSVRAVGVLLINALLIVPAATACNLARNLRQLFWLTILLCLVACLGGQLISWEVERRTQARLGVQGAIILLSVALFCLSMIIPPLVARIQSWFRPRPETPAA